MIILISIIIIITVTVILVILIANKVMIEIHITKIMKQIFWEAINRTRRMISSRIDMISDIIEHNKAFTNDR